jgi:hypothetical protein
MTFKVEITGLGNIQSRLDRDLGSEVRRLSDAVFKEVRANTPVDTGRARAGWRRQNSDKSFEITNDVPYVPVLDRGRHMTTRGMRGSKQAPKGIIGPSLDKIKGSN